VTSFAIRDAVDDLPRLAVIDVGVLGAAQWIHWRFLSERAIGTLTGFDPDPGACARCNMQAPPGIAYLPGLVADGNPVRLHRTRDPRYTSVFRPNTAFASAFEGLAEACQVERVERLDSIRLADVSLPVGAGCDYLRVGVRGAEALVLENAGGHLATAAVVHTTAAMAPLYEEAPAFDRVDAVLGSRGFIMHRFFDGVSASLASLPGLAVAQAESYGGQLLWSEAIYVKDYTDPCSQPLSVWLSLALAAHEMIDAPDLACRALANADILDGGERAARYLDSYIAASGVAFPAAATTAVVPTRARGWLARLLGR